MAYVRSKMCSMGMRGKKHKGPLRDVVEVYSFAEGLFSHDSVLFSCGHKGRRSYGAIKGRCSTCGNQQMEKEITA